MAWDIQHVVCGGYAMREKACQMACDIWHGIVGHGIYIWFDM
jgi:hypothetical protein